MAKRITDPIVRFWANVDTSGDCWVWQAALNEAGYGMFRISTPRRRMITAHRFSFETANGPVPADLVIDHICHTRACVRPDHLRLVTHKQNAEHRSADSKIGRSGVRGVVWNGTRKTWMAQVRHHGRLYIGGQYSTIGEAAECVRRLRNDLYTHNDLDRIEP